MTINVAEYISFKEYYSKITKINNINRIPVFIIKNNEIYKVDTFLKKININNKFYLGIDFEFNNINNKRNVALIQINYNDEFIFMFHPEKLITIHKNMLKKILFNDNCIKILHGSESLDIKYLFEQFFTNYNEKKKFLKNFYDTKFICDYLNVRDNLSNKKCKIYQLILKSGIINDNIYKKLILNEEKMGPIYKVIVNVNTMNKELIYYTLFDVFYLIQLFKKLNVSSFENDMINYFLHPTLLEKKKIENDIIITNQFNNNFVLDCNNNRYTINYIMDYYSDFYYHTKFNLNIINDIPYLKKIFNLTLKKIILDIISKKLIIYQNKETKSNNNIKKLILQYQLILPKNEIIEKVIKFIKKDILLLVKKS